MVDFVKKFSVFCSLISAGGPLETTKLRGYGLLIFVALAAVLTKIKLQKGGNSYAKILMAIFGIVKKFDRKSWRAPLVTCKKARGLHPPSYG